MNTDKTGDLLVGKRQSRKISARKGDLDSTQAETESGDQFLANYQPSKAKHVKKPVGRSRKSEPARRLNRSDEYEEDEGRLESQYATHSILSHSSRCSVFAPANISCPGNSSHWLSSRVRRRSKLRSRRQTTSTGSPRL
jgi:hypothetical protein